MSDILPFETPSQMRLRIAELTAELEQHRLKSGGGDGTSGGMTEDWKKSVEDRLVDLRTDMRELRDAAGDLKVDIATIKENMRHLPTQTWLFKAMAGLVAAMGVVTAIIIRFVPHA